jgi:hypothetical protein
VTTPPPHPAAAAAAAPPPPWRLAGSLVSLKAAIDAHWPGRDKRSDGGIGDARHAARGRRVRSQSVAEQHDPGRRLHRHPARHHRRRRPVARRVPAAGRRRRRPPAGRQERGRQRQRVRDLQPPHHRARLQPVGRLRRPDPHTTHVHVSVTRDPAGYDDGGPWAFLTQVPQHPVSPHRRARTTTPPAPATASAPTSATRARDRAPAARAQHLRARVLPPRGGRDLRAADRPRPRRVRRAGEPRGRHPQRGPAGPARRRRAERRPPARHAACTTTA